MFKTTHYFRFAVVFLLLFCGVSLAQSDKIEFKVRQQAAKEKRTTEEAIRTNAILDQRIQNRKTLEKALIELDAVDGWVIPEEYPMGPGDILAINLSGSLPQYLEVLVSSEGLVDVPGHFTVDLKGKTLAEAKSLLEKKLRTYYQDSDVSINLVSIRPMKVFVLGNVYSIGACLAKPMDRLFDVITRSGGAKRLANLSDIRIYRGADTLIVDGAKYQRTGDLASNPRLLDGDVVFVPSAILNEQTVSVQGGVLEPGLYPLYHKQTLSSFLENYMDYGEDVELGTITVTRYEQNDKKMYAFDLNNPEVDKEMRQFQVQAGDMIEIGMLSQIYVQGEVNLPGAYPFISNFKAIDYIGLAGGNTRRGRSRAITVIHQDGTRSKGLYSEVTRGDVIVVPMSLTSILAGESGVIQVIGTVASIFLTINVISNRK